MKNILLVCCLSCFFGGNAQQFLGSWTDGEYLYNAKAISKDKIQFEGGTLHEGGAMFLLQKEGEKQGKIIGSSLNTTYAPTFGSVGDMVELTTLNAYPVILLKGKDQQVKNILQQESNLERRIVTNKMKFQLAGKYKVKGTEQVISFAANEQKVQGWQAGTEYRFHYEYDSPVDIILVGNTYYGFQKGFRSLILQQLDTYGKPVKGKKLELDFITTTENEKIIPQGDYGFASVIPLLRSILRNYTPEELRLIRNEIFARQGYEFSSSDLQKYFSSKSWYEPKGAKIPIQLTQIEKINIALLKYMEGMRKKQNLTIYDKLQGKWRSELDANTILWFDGNKRKENTEGEQNWYSEDFVLSEACVTTPDNISGSMKKRGRYLSCPENEMCWYIVSVDEKQLQLSYVGRGNTLTYRKLK